LSFRKDGYEEQTVKVKVLDGHTLNISINMFLIPIPSDIGLLNQLPDGVYFLDFTNNQDLNTVNKKDWAKAINYWFRTRGDFISGNIRLSEIAYFIDNEGKVYNSSGNEISSDNAKLQKEDKIVYLGNATESGVTELAQSSLKKFFNTDLTEPSVKVFITPNNVGFLRVREAPTTNSKELTKVDTNLSFPLLDEQQGWYQIEFEEGKTGWVSGIYSELVGDNTKATENVEANTDQTQ
ncbi:MAG: SH3 domain-containing protein, partial [Romboutsia sp.]|nr:SH3 domain-containing protein [Romboutsia sp.]